MSNLPAGWYPDPDRPHGRRRFWNGAQWTDAVLPPPPLPPLPRGSATPAPARRRRRVWPAVLVGVGILAGAALLVVGVVVGAPLTRPADPVRLPTTPAAVDSPATAFQTDADKQLDDMDEDLDDIVTTVEQNGLFRLYSNSVELAFNLGQLRAIAVPESVSTTWPPALAAIDRSLSALDDAIPGADATTILSAVDAVRADVDAARSVAATAQ